MQSKLPKRHSLFYRNVMAKVTYIIEHGEDIERKRYWHSHGNCSAKPSTWN